MTEKTTTPVETKKTEDIEKLTTTAKGLVAMLEKATEAYGDRTVKVEINGRNYIINDLKFTANGNEFILCLNKPAQKFEKSFMFQIQESICKNIEICRIDMIGRKER